MLATITFQTPKPVDLSPCVFKGLRASFWADFQTNCPRGVLRGFLAIRAPYPLPRPKHWPNQAPCAPRHLVQMRFCTSKGNKALRRRNGTV
jgi:hypothetical protein